MAYSQGTGSGGPVGSYQALGGVRYNYAQLEGIWVQAGGAVGAAPIAAAIAMAESGGNTTATNNDGNGSTDRGLWQINSVHGAQSTYDVMGNARAAVAISNNGTNWAPWTTYGNGAYRQFLQTNVPPDTSAPINGTNAQANQSTATLTASGGANTGPLPGGLKDPANWFLNPLGSIAGAAEGGASSAAGQAAGAVGGTLIKYALQGFILTILNPVIQIMAGIMGISAGAAMVVVGLWVMARNTETGQQAERAGAFAVQTGLSAAAPETTAATRYVGQAKEPGGERPVTTVTQRRRGPGQVRWGGRTLQYRPGAVQTDVSREGSRSYGDTYIPPGTRDQLVNEANGYNRNAPPPPRPGRRG